MRQAGNLFAYGLNNPLMFIDPSGLFIIPLVIPFLPAIPKGVGTLLYILGITTVGVTSAYAVYTVIDAVTGNINTGIGSSSSHSLHIMQTIGSSTITEIATITAISSIANMQLRNHAFYAVEGKQFNSMWRITPAEALIRAIGGGNVYTQDMSVAKRLATMAGFGVPPDLFRLNHSGELFNAHFHVFWQHFDIFGNHILSELNAHIFFGLIRDGGGEVQIP